MPGAFDCQRRGGRRAPGRRDARLAAPRALLHRHLAEGGAGGPAEEPVGVGRNLRGDAGRQVEPGAGRDSQRRAARGADERSVAMLAREAREQVAVARRGVGRPRAVVTEPVVEAEEPVAPAPGRGGEEALRRKPPAAESGRPPVVDEDREEARRPAGAERIRRRPRRKAEPAGAARRQRHPPAVRPGEGRRHPRVARKRDGVHRRGRGDQTRELARRDDAPLAVRVERRHAGEIGAAEAAQARVGDRARLRQADQLLPLRLREDRQHRGQRRGDVRRAYRRAGGPLDGERREQAAVVDARAPRRPAVARVEAAGGRAVAGDVEDLVRLYGGENVQPRRVLRIRHPAGAGVDSAALVVAPVFLLDAAEPVLGGVELHPRIEERRPAVVAGALDHREGQTRSVQLDGADAARTHRYGHDPRGVGNGGQQFARLPQRGVPARRVVRVGLRDEERIGERALRAVGVRAPGDIGSACRIADGAPVDGAAVRRVAAVVGGPVLHDGVELGDPRVRQTARVERDVLYPLRGGLPARGRRDRRGPRIGRRLRRGRRHRRARIRHRRRRPAAGAAAATRQRRRDRGQRRRGDHPSSVVHPLLLADPSRMERRRPERNAAGAGSQHRPRGAGVAARAGA